MTGPYPVLFLMATISPATRRRVLVWLVLLASIPAIWRYAELREVLLRDRLAAEAFAQGQQLQASGQLAEAIEAFENAVHNASVMDRDLYESLALAQFRHGQIDDAVTTYRRIIAVYPHTYNAVLYRNLGLVELKAGRFRDAGWDLLMATRLDPTDVLAFHFLGQALAASNDTAGARAAWKRAISLNPQFRPSRDRLRELDASP